MTAKRTRTPAAEVPRVETTETLRVGDRVTYKRKVGTVLSIGGMGYVRLLWDGQSRRMDTPARFLRRLPT